MGRRYRENTRFLFTRYKDDVSERARKKGVTKMQVLKESSRPAGTGTAAKSGNVKDTFYRVNYNTKRIILQVLIPAFCLGMVSAAAIYEFSSALADKLFAEKYVYAEVEHVVKKGDTLWSIAERYKPEGVAMQEYMAWVYERNDGGTIYPGDVVVMGVAE